MLSDFAKDPADTSLRTLENQKYSLYIFYHTKNSALKLRSTCDMFIDNRFIEVCNDRIDT